MELNGVYGGNGYQAKLSDKLDIALHSNVEYDKESDKNARVGYVYINGKIATPFKFKSSDKAKAFVIKSLILVLEDNFEEAMKYLMDSKVIA